MVRRRTLADRIAQERRKKSVAEWRDVEKKEVAEGVGVSESTYGRWEAGLTTPDESAIERVAAYFGTTALALRYGDGNPELPPKRFVSGAEAKDLLEQHQAKPQANAGEKRRRGSR